MKLNEIKNEIFKEEKQTILIVDDAKTQLQY